MINNVSDALYIGISQLAYFVRVVHTPFTIFKYFYEFLDMDGLFEVDECIAPIAFVLKSLIINTWKSTGT